MSEGVIALSAASYATCAIVAGGAAKCWGLNVNGQLGDGTQENRNVPTDVVGLSSGVAGISVGAGHACALASTGGVTCWGQGTVGQVGNPSLTNLFTATTVPGLPNGIRAVAAGGRSSCAIPNDGGLICWGLNMWDVLGVGASGNAVPNPSVVLGMEEVVTEVAGGTYHKCAMTTSGDVFCWGGNLVGQTSSSTLVLNTSPPVRVANL